MNDHEDQKWQNLLAQSSPAFVGETEPRYGFITSTLAQLKREKRQQEELERIGWRALLASLAALAIAATMTLTVNYRDGGSDFEPGMRSLVQMDNFQVS
jgi:hypothetical protein